MSEQTYAESGCGRCVFFTVDHSETLRGWLYCLARFRVASVDRSVSPDAKEAEPMTPAPPDPLAEIRERVKSRYGKLGGYARAFEQMYADIDALLAQVEALTQENERLQDRLGTQDGCVELLKMSRDAAEASLRVCIQERDKLKRDLRMYRDWPKIEEPYLHQQLQHWQRTANANAEQAHQRSLELAEANTRATDAYEQRDMFKREADTMRDECRRLRDKIND